MLHVAKQALFLLAKTDLGRHFDSRKEGHAVFSGTIGFQTRFLRNIELLLPARMGFF